MDDNRDNALRLTHRFAGPPDLVWAIWTRPELIRSWFGSSHGFRAHDIAVDLRPGGNWSLRNVRGAVTDWSIPTISREPSSSVSFRSILRPMAMARGWSFCRQGSPMRRPGSSMPRAGHRRSA
jgi:uncharacterized protein YndB with AHSA1/START domain